MYIYVHMYTGLNEMDNITLQQEIWEILLVFYAHPSELSIQLSKIHLNPYQRAA